MLSHRAAIVWSALIALCACGKPEMALPRDGAGASPYADGADGDEATSLLQRAKFGRGHLGKADCTVLQDTDYEGGDYKHVSVDTTEACCAACGADSQCKAGVLYLGVCYLKNKIGAGIASKGRVAVLAGGTPSPAPACNVQQDTDYEGGDYRRVRADSPEACCAACGADTQCKAGVLYLGYCYLKNNIGVSSSSNGRVAVLAGGSPTPAPTPSQTPAPTPAPTPAQTLAPTPSPATPAPTPATTPAPTPSPAPVPPLPVPCGKDVDGTWEITDTCVLKCKRSFCNYTFDTIRVKEGGELRVEDEVDIQTTIFARLFIVEEGGKLVAGTEDAPLASFFEIVLTGKSSDQDDPSVHKEVLGHGSAKAARAAGLPYSKVLLGKAGAFISLHGQPKTSWIKLAASATAGSKSLKLADVPSGWRPGDKLILPSTGMGPQSGDNEVVTIAAVQGNDVSLVEALRFDHYAASADTRLNGEVGVLTRNVRITGENSKHDDCLEALKGTFSNRDALNKIRELCYGGHTATMKGATFQLSNVEMTRLGQATRIARYPVHFHLAADVSGLKSYARSNAIWENYQRCVTIHGTWGASVEDNLCYYTHGHAFYLEDSIEHNNRFVKNIAVKIRRGPMVCTDSQVGPSAFWITNPNNTFIDNLAVDVGGAGHGIGYWMISGGDQDKETGPSYIGTDYWTDDFNSKRAGEIFQPSRSIFGEDSSIPRWILGQQQGRTPLKEFRGNGVRSSFRGVHVDGFVTASVPGEIGDDIHPPEDIHVFGINDGTCNYFPAGPYAISYAEGMRVYVPTDFEYNADGQAENFSPSYSIMDGLHISRCYESWWSRASRMNITNALFAWNWVGMTNHIPGGNFCPGTGEPSNVGLANHVVNTLFVGHGDAVMNEQICAVGQAAQGSQESPAAIRQYDGAFWLSNSRWVNMSTVSCPGSAAIKTLPYSLVAGRQRDCNGKFPVQLFDSWPLGAAASDATGSFSWALNFAERVQNLAQFSGTASCQSGPSGGVVDMTGTLNPRNPSSPIAYFAISGSPQNPGELAEYTAEELEGMHYSTLPGTGYAAVSSAAWSANFMEHPDFGHMCGYCFYDEGPNACPSGPSAAAVPIV